MYRENNRIYKIAGLVILALLLLAALFLFRGCSADRSGEDGPGNLIYDDNAVDGGWDEADPEKIVASLNEKVEEGMINISMNTAPVFADGTAKGNLMIVNEEINNYPQIVEITRDDTGETIYKSGGIPIGSKIESAKLDVDLPAGTYPCTAMFHNVNTDTDASLVCAEASITITVLK